MWLCHTSHQPFLAPVPMSVVVAMETAASHEHASLRLMHGPEVRAWLRAVAGADVALSRQSGSGIASIRYVVLGHAYGPVAVVPPHAGG